MCIVKQMNEKQICDLLNSRSDVTFNLGKYEDLTLNTKTRVLNIRSRKTQYGQKLLIEIENDTFLFLPSRYTDLFIKDESDHFFLRTPSLYMTVVSFHTEENEKGETYVTPVLTFSVELKRTYAAASKPGGAGNSSIEALASHAKSFDAVKNAVKNKASGAVRRLILDEKKAPLQDSQTWDAENWE